MSPLKRFLTSRFPKRHKSNQTEAPLWDRLDACGIDFRAPMQDLIARYGSTPSGWSQQLHVCNLGGKTSFIDGLAHQPAFQFSPDSDLNSPPRDIFCAVQASADHRINYAKAIAALVKHFGSGTIGEAANTASREWRFGHATMTCTVWPPDAQSPGRNTRHDMFPETITEAAIWIAPAYRTPLTPTEITYCETASPLPTPKLPSPRLIAVGRLTRDWPSALSPLKTGLYLTQADAALLKQTTPGLIDILPRSWMREIGLDRITGGRGGQEAIVSLHYSPSGQTDMPAQTLMLCEQYGDPNSLDQFADELAKRLSLSINLYEGPRD